ncbi:MAG: hypothetical protein JWO90_270 [Solirubrobacterales bacterium]|jgi:hypothetical protein|nr:hypothetical protein [Solirubrobacterales bacterium]
MRDDDDLQAQLDAEGLGRIIAEAMDLAVRRGAPPELLGDALVSACLQRVAMLAFKEGVITTSIQLERTIRETTGVELRLQPAVRMEHVPFEDDGR